MTTRPIRSALQCLMLAASLSALLLGCANVDTVKKARGQGARRLYDSPYEQVFNAVIAAAAAKRLDVLETDRAARRVVLSHGVTWPSWGENVAVFLTPVTPRSTEVEIVSKAVTTPLNFPPDRDRILLAQTAIVLSRGK